MKGIKEVGGNATIYQCVRVLGMGSLHFTLTMVAFRIAETLPEEILAKLHAPAKPEYPILEPNDLANFDAFLIGIPTRYGNWPAQWKVCVAGESS